MADRSGDTPRRSWEHLGFAALLLGIAIVLAGLLFTLVGGPGYPPNEEWGWWGLGIAALGFASVVWGSLRVE